jgi:hypothetical protein
MFEEPAVAGIGGSSDIGLPSVASKSVPDGLLSSFQLALSTSPAGRSSCKEADAGDCRDTSTLWHVADLHFATSGRIPGQS